MNTLKCILLSAVKHRTTENALHPLTWSICGGPSTGFVRFSWGCQGNGTGWIHGQLMAEIERNLHNYLTQNYHDKEDSKEWKPWFFKPETPAYLGVIFNILVCICYSFKGCIGDKSPSSVAYTTYCHISYIPRVHAYLLTTNINSSPIAGHYLHVLHVIISWVSFTPVDPS